LAKAGVATGAARPFAMTEEEIGRAKDYLTELKPNILKLAQAGTEEVRAFSEGAAVISTILGFDLRIKEAGGPEARSVLLREGTIAFADGEMIVAASEKRDLIERFLEADFQPEWIAKRFLKYPHPHFDERAYKLLVDQGHQELADRVLYNRPDLPFDVDQVALVAPPPNQTAYTDAFNEVFGA
jgi:spermidine/putrescine-binding protein